MTGAQHSYLETLSTEAGEEFDETLFAKGDVFGLRDQQAGMNGLLKTIRSIFC